MPGLSSNNQKILLQLAHDSIRQYLEAGGLPGFSTTDPELTQLCGCFVTLYKRKNLAGCIGTFERATPLYRNVLRMAQSAAFYDPRFPALKKDELDQIRIEISVLGELEAISSLDEIEIGRHGILTRLGDRSGTLLPQVAVEQNWSREQFVLYCAREKAGFTPEECARAEMLRYEVIKFGD